MTGVRRLDMNAYISVPLIGSAFVEVRREWVGWGSIRYPRGDREIFLGYLQLTCSPAEGGGASRKSLLAVGAAASIGLIGAVALTHRGAQSDINQPHAELINPQVENIPSLDMMDKWHYMVLPPGD